MCTGRTGPGACCPHGMACGCEEGDVCPGDGAASAAIKDMSRSWLSLSFAAPWMKLPDPPHRPLAASGDADVPCTRRGSSCPGPRPPPLEPPYRALQAPNSPPALPAPLAPDPQPSPLQARVPGSRRGGGHAWRREQSGPGGAAGGGGRATRPQPRAPQRRPLGGAGRGGAGRRRLPRAQLGSCRGPGLRAPQPGPATRPPAPPAPPAAPHR